MGHSQIPDTQPVSQLVDTKCTISVVRKYNSYSLHHKVTLHRLILKHKRWSRFNALVLGLLLLHQGAMKNGLVKSDVSLSTQDTFSFTLPSDWQSSNVENIAVGLITPVDKTLFLTRLYGLCERNNKGILMRMVESNN